MGYDAGDFAHYLGWQRGKQLDSWISISTFLTFILNLLFIAEDGTNIDNWSLEDLMQCVQDYYVYCQNQ